MKLNRVAIYTLCQSFVILSFSSLSFLCMTFWSLIVVTSNNWKKILVQLKSILHIINDTLELIWKFILMQRLTGVTSFFFFIGQIVSFHITKYNFNHRRGTSE